MNRIDANLFQFFGFLHNAVHARHGLIDPIADCLQGISGILNLFLPGIQNSPDIIHTRHSGIRIGIEVFHHCMDPFCRIFLLSYGKIRYNSISRLRTVTNRGSHPSDILRQSRPCTAAVLPPSETDLLSADIPENPPRSSPGSLPRCGSPR